MIVLTRKEEHLKKKEDKNTLPLKLLPHQKFLLENIHNNVYPIYICWKMGSGKTIGACMCMKTLPQNSKILIICDKSTVIQWKTETQRVLLRNIDQDVTVHIIHYEYLNRPESPIPEAYDMTIVDEAHRFRNAFSRESCRMLHWISLIKACTRVIYLSGTPIIHDADIERKSFDNLMMRDSNDTLKGRVFFYDPKTDPKSEKKYPSLEEICVHCSMSWAQCLTYFMNKRQSFTLQIEGEEHPRTRISSSKNTYNTLVRAISNNPFPETPNLSPKFQKMLQQMELADSQNLKQIVYSCRKDTGVKALQELWTSLADKHSFQITGDMSQEERASNIKDFNRKPNSVLFITDAGGQGIDLKRVNVVHIMEPAENIQDENQIINRAVRYKSHSDADSSVCVFRYICTFPTDGKVEAPWKHILYSTGLFDKSEMKGITRKVQYALKKIIREENYKTVDEKIMITRAERETKILREMEDIKTQSYN